MGTATNQIATEKDLYYSGFTNFASDGISGDLGVTYGDIWNKTQSTTKEGLKTFTVLPTLQLGYGSSVNLQAPQGIGQNLVLAIYDLLQIKDFDTIKFSKDGDVNITVNNTGNTQITVILRLGYGSNTKTLTNTVNAFTSKTINSSLHQILEYSQVDFTTSIFKNIDTIYWEVEIQNGSATITNNYTQNQMIIQCCTETQLIKYQNIGGKDNPYYVNWNVKISENVSLSTAANKIELRYYYSNEDAELLISSTNYKVIGTWIHDGNISGSAEEIIQVNVNPLNIYSGQTFKQTCLGLWCGSTKNNQTWSCRLKTPSQSSFTNDYEEHNYKGKDSLFVIWANGSLVPAWEGIILGKDTSPVDFLANVKQFNGVEFKIDN